MAFRKPTTRHAPLIVAGLASAAVLAAMLARADVASPRPETSPTTCPATYECRWATAPVTIDGKPDDAAWQSAQLVDRFSLPWLGAADRPAKTATRARLLWDREYLYFLADCDDADLHAPVAEHDGPLWEHDAFEIFFKPAANKPGYYEFEFNPANAVLDLFLPARNTGGWARFKSEGDFDIRTAVQLRGTLNKHDDRDQGWMVEGRIGWRSFMRTGGRPEPGEAWTFNLCRVDDSKQPKQQELSTAMPLGGPKPNFHRYEDYTPITFVGPDGPPARAGAELLPALTTSRVVGSPEPPPPYRAVRAYPNLKLPNPIWMAPQPGSGRMLALVAAWSYAPTKLVWFNDSPDVSTYEEHVEIDAVAYDFTFHPEFARNGYLYVGMNGPQSAPEGAMRQTKVVRYKLDPNPPYGLDPKSATTIIEWDSNGHNGGALDFGPDGMLYVTSGDGTPDSDRWHSGQDGSRLLAKVLRIDVDRPDPGRHYSVPKDNPFVNVPDVRPETWCYGLRNPWRMKADPKTGQLWLAQNGQDLFEQVYLVEKGRNYGWSATEGSAPFYPDRKRGPAPDITPPTAEHSHADARSLTGGIAYHGDALPGLRGAYVYGDFSTGKIWGIRHDGTRVTWHQEIADTTLRITGFATNARGELLVLDHQKDGAVYRLEPTPPPTGAAAAFPRKLSESGLFKSVAGHAMQPGVLPYSVNAELWSDGAHKERFMAIPGQPGDANRRVTFAAKNGFEFPDETVLVKSFALDAADGARRWVETRFLTKQQGEWVGYSYAWNDEQTDATLVEARGADRAYTVRDATAPGGVRRQTWHFPSRSECMFCHSRAANYVLGPSLLQFNKDHDYGGGRVENQLRALERTGLLKVDYKAEMIAAARAEGKRRGLTKDALDAHVKANAQASGQREAKPSHLLVKDPSAYDRLPNPHDASADLNARARSYLHANCAICHVEAGGGNAAFEVDYNLPPDKTRLFDVAPLHDGFGLRDPRLVAPGAPDRSVLLHRMTIRGTGQMPPLATSVVDEKAVALMREWIEQTRPAPVQPEPPGPAGQ